MKVHSQGVLDTSNIYFHTPSEMARKMFFYLLCTGHYYCDKTYLVDRQSYNSFLVLYVLKGKGYVEQGGRQVTLTEGCIAILDCYKPHRYGTNTGWEFIWCHYDGPMARSYYEAITQSGNFVITPQNPYSAQRSLEKTYAMFHEASKAMEATISKYITNVLTEILVSESSAASENMQSSTTENILAYIAENVAQPLTLEHLAQKAALSPFYFTRVFKKETGYTPHEYLIIARINAAKYYLKTSVLPIKEVSINCGFSSESTFCTTFKRVVGTTPLMYRRNDFL